VRHAPVCNQHTSPKLGSLCFGIISHAGSPSQCLGFVMILVDDGHTFKGMFKETYEILNIRYHPIANGNHNALIFERFHAFLNKSVAIASNERCNLFDVYIPVRAITVYPWISKLIDGTDVIRNVLWGGAASLNYHWILNMFQCHILF
jgi:hypothetical protein